MNKLYITILFSIVTPLLAQGQSGYVDLSIVDSKGAPISFGGMVTFTEVNSNSKNSEMYFENAIYPLNPGDYSLIFQNGVVETIENNITLIETSDTLKFSLSDSDTLKLQLNTKTDTLYPTNEKYIDLLGIKGDFFCHGYDCTDSDNKKFGLTTGYYSQISGISGITYSVYIEDHLILQIHTENQNKTYCYNFRMDPKEKIVIENYAMDYEEVLSFIRENIDQDELKQDLSWRDKKI